MHLDNEKKRIARIQKRELKRTGWDLQNHNPDPYNLKDKVEQLRRIANEEDMEKEKFRKDIKENSYQPIY